MPSAPAAIATVGGAFCLQPAGVCVLFLFWHLEPLGAQVSFGQTVRHCARLPAPTRKDKRARAAAALFCKGCRPWAPYIGGAVLARAQVPFHPAATARPPEGGRERPQIPNLVGSFIVLLIFAALQGPLQIYELKPVRSLGPFRVIPADPTSATELSRGTGAEESAGLE